jgi:hypothetical protein
VPPFRGGTQLRLPSIDHPSCLRWFVDGHKLRFRLNSQRDLNFQKELANPVYARTQCVGKARMLLLVFWLQ